MVSRNVSSNKPSAAAIEWKVHYLLLQLFMFKIFPICLMLVTAHCAQKGDNDHSLASSRFEDSAEHFINVEIV